MLVTLARHFNNLGDADETIDVDDKTARRLLREGKARLPEPPEDPAPHNPPPADGDQPKETTDGR